jgi:hypothetical protein
VAEMLYEGERGTNFYGGEWQAGVVVVTLIRIISIWMQNKSKIYRQTPKNEQNNIILSQIML